MPRELGSCIAPQRRCLAESGCRPIQATATTRGHAARHDTGGPYRPWSIQSRVRRAFRRAGPDAQPVRGALVRGLRTRPAAHLRYRARQLQRECVPLMKLVGHESMATSQRYVAGAASETRTAAAKKPYAIVRDRLQLGGHDIMNLSAACWRARLAWRRRRHSHQSPVVVEQASASRHGSVCRRAHLYRRHRDMRSRPVAPRHRSPGSTISGRPSPQPGEIA